MADVETRYCDYAEGHAGEHARHGGVNHYEGSCGYVIGQFAVGQVDEHTRLAQLQRDLAVARAEAARYRAALEPFAALWPHVERQPSRNDAHPIWQTDEATITQGHVKAARAALEPTQ